MILNYKNLHKNMTYNEFKQKGESISDIWQEIEDKALFLNTEVDSLWPNEKKINEAIKYPYPYRISNDTDWTMKPFKERESDNLVELDDKDNLLYNIKDEFNVLFTKKEVEESDQA